MNEDSLGSNSELGQTSSASSPNAGPNDGLADSSGGQGTGAADSQSDSMSSEDNNTQSDDYGTDGEGQSRKAQSRQQTLANGNRELAGELERERSARLAAEQRYAEVERNVKTNMQQSNDPGYRFQAQQALQNAKLLRMEEEREFEKAALKHPELNPDSPEYDASFHDDVWLIREGSKDYNGSPQMSYAEAAERLRKRNQKIASKAVHEAETQIEQKMATSSGPQRRTGAPSSGAANELKNAEGKFAQTGSVEDLANVLKAKRGLS
jgi:hypothetical protein